MNRFFLKIIFAGIVLLCIAHPVVAQRSNGLTVEGTVSVEEGAVDGAIIQMFRDGLRMDNYGIGANGRYLVELNYNHEFTLIFARSGNFPQKIVVDTKVPRAVLQSDPLFPPFPVDIKLFTEISGIDRTFSENTVMKIYYSENVDNFISDLYYNDAQIKHLIDQAILQSQMISQEADYLAGLTKAELAELRKEYDQLIKAAENEYKNEEFLSALDGYQAASKIFPKEQYPKDRIAEINDLLGLLMVAEEMQQALAERLEELIAQADAFFDEEKYIEARNAYRRALSVNPNHLHAKQRAEEIAEILRKQQMDQEYRNLIVQADNAFRELLYVEARNSYLQALQKKEGETYPQQKIDEIDEILAKQVQNAEQLKNYEESVFQAELNFEKQFYEKAISFYENALIYKQDDEVAIQRIREIRELMNELANRTLYDRVIKTADRAFQRKQYPEALTEYEQAAELLPKEEYPKDQINRISEIFEEQARLKAEAEAAEQARLAALQAEQDRQYNQAVSRGDSLFNLNEYENSRIAYQSALQVKPDETYPQQRISEIGQLLGQLVEAQQAYDAAIARADRDFQREAFTEAKSAYTEAQQAKPEEVYPTEQITKIDSIVETRVRLAAEAEAAEQARLAALQAEQDQQYNQAVSRGDRLFNLNEYENSRTAYQSALQVKPDETYPQQRISEIGQLLGQLAAAQQVYDATIARADRDFQRESFTEAKSAYTEAQQAKPEEVYPAEQITKIDSIVETRARMAAEAEAEKARLAAEAEAAEQARLAALQAEQDRQYNQAVSRGDSLFNLNEYENSRIAYQSALQVKPDETYPQQRISEIGQLLGQLIAAQQAYDAAITRADRDFQRESFTEAKSAYTEAQQAKPEEVYPAEQITKIDSIVETRARMAAEAEAEKARLAAEAEAAEQARLAALQAEQDRQYNQAVSRGDSLFNLNEYENSRTAYQSALQVKPDETYPQQRISEIGQLLGQLAAAQQAYDAAIARADRDFQREAFTEAKSAYTEAQQAKPEEVYPAEQITKIDSIVETRARMAAEAEAEKARLAAEAEATEQARLAALQAEQDRQYNQAVSRGDSLFNLNEYENSRTAYQSALQVKPDETYPQQRISEIGQLLGQLAAAQQAYDAAIARADRDFQREAFTEAKSAYTEAQQAKPEEVYPAEQITKIDSIVETRARMAAEAEAEKARLAAEAEAAEQARLAALQAEQDRQYNQAVSRGDSLFNLNEYENSRTAYQSALQVKPDETYPQQRISEIGQLLGQLVAAQQAYDAAIARADRDFQRESFTEAKSAYTEAQQAKPEEVYPAEQITKIDSIVETRARMAAEAEAAEQARLAALQAEQDRQYNQAVSRGDSLFNLNEYENSRTAYQSALHVKPDETYPQQKIDEIVRIFQERDENYRSVILVADGFFNADSLQEAKTEYEKALTIKSDENYSKSQIVKIENLLRQQQERALAEQRSAEEMERRRAAIEQRQQEISNRQEMSETGLNQLYNEYISLADGFFDNKRYNVSRAWYFKAWDVKPQETYPPQRIDEINSLVGSLLLNQRDRDYQGFIDLADSTFRENQLAVARGWYNRALSVKPNENYPKEQLQVIAGLIAERMASRSGEQFNSHMQNASEAFENGNYNVARFWYKKALELRPDDGEAKEGIQKIEEALR